MAEAINPSSAFINGRLKLDSNKAQNRQKTKPGSARFSKELQKIQNKSKPNLDSINSNPHNLNKANLNNSSNKSKINQTHESSGTDLAAKKVAMEFEKQFYVFYWTKFLASDDKDYEGGFGESMYSSMLAENLVKQSREGKMGQIAKSVYKQIKKDKDI